MLDAGNHQSLEMLFRSTAETFTDDVSLISKHWGFIQKHYSSSGRYYHTLDHLEYMREGLSRVKQEIDDWEAILFALFFHDFFYSPTLKGNERRSAVHAANVLRSFRFPQPRIERVRYHIMSTAGHETTSDGDSNIFIDADLSILGADPSDYREYVSRIRREYSLYPDLLYNAGRKKVLTHFLAMPRIFKTGSFHWLEEQARANLAYELSLLAN